MTARSDFPWLAAVCADRSGPHAAAEAGTILDELDTLRGLVAEQEQQLAEWAAHHARIQADMADLYKTVADL